MLIIKLEINYQILIESITIISSWNTSDKLMIIEIGLPAMMKKIKMNNKLKINKHWRYNKVENNYQCKDQNRNKKEKEYLIYFLFE
jgi:hypothetical protein